jgi:hypothetical protein
MFARYGCGPDLYLMLTATPLLDKKLSNEGTVAFFSFNDPLEKADGEKLVTEVKVCILPACALNDGR